MPRFRPMPVLTVFAIPALVLLLVLGGWQLQRMHWKTELIAAYQQIGTVSSFQDALCQEPNGAFGPRIIAPAPLSGPQLRYYALRGRPGWVRIGLMPVAGCTPGEPPRLMLVESGFEDLLTGEMTAPAAWRIEALPAAGGFASGNDPETNQWYSFDRSRMAEALAADPGSVLDLWARSDLGLPASLSQTPPARHFGYALTWFGLALALVGVYLALHIARGRLR